jgi:RNA-directed DNA polymerase
VQPSSIVFGHALLAGVRDDLKARRFQPLPVKERMIPKANGKRRRLDIPTAWIALGCSPRCRMTT